MKPIIRNGIKKEKDAENKKILEALREKMDEEGKRLNDLIQEVGSSNWLTTLSIKDHGYVLNKQQFCNAIRTRYNWEIPRLTSHCGCGASFEIENIMSYKKGGYVALRHNELRDFVANIFLKFFFYYF